MSRYESAGSVRTTLRSGVMLVTRKRRPGLGHSCASRVPSQNRSRASGKVAPKARFDSRPLTTVTRRSRASSSDPLFSSGPSCTT